jgi:cysteine desulfurase
MTGIIDLDANATTSLLPQVRDAILQALDYVQGNPASDTRLGAAGRKVIENARRDVSALIQADPEEIVFTSGATEAINLGIRGTISALGLKRCHVITTEVEHPAVLRTVEHLHDTRRIDVTCLVPDRHGRVTAQQVTNALRPTTVLVAAIHGNNEIGSLNPIREIGAALRPHSIRFLVDASQTLAYCPPSVRDDHVDVLIMSAHKMHGPKGVGAIYVRRDLPLKPIMHGGGQERGLRPGTENTAMIAGFGTACRISRRDAPRRCKSVGQLRDAFLAAIQEVHPDVRLNGHPTLRLPNNLSLTIPGVESYKLQKRLESRLAFSRGSACSSGSGVPSHVLKAIGLVDPDLHWTIRIGLSCLTTSAEIDTAASLLNQTIRLLRGR